MSFPASRESRPGDDVTGNREGLGGRRGGPGLWGGTGTGADGDLRDHARGVGGCDFRPLGTPRAGVSLETENPGGMGSIHGRCSLAIGLVFIQGGRRSDDRVFRGLSTNGKDTEAKAPRHLVCVPTSTGADRGRCVLCLWARSPTSIGCVAVVAVVAGDRPARPSPRVSEEGVGVGATSLRKETDDAKGGQATLS